MNKRIFAVLALVIALLATTKAMATNPVPKPKPQQPTNCIKQPEIVKKAPAQVKAAEKPKPATIAKLHTEPNTNSVPHFTIFNFFNSFYTKDTLDHLQVM